MLKSIGTALAVTIAALSLAAPARAVSPGDRGCDPELRPAPVVRVEQTGAGIVTARVTVTRTASACSPVFHAWVITHHNVRQWKRYSRTAPRACQMWARDQRGVGVTTWTKWHDVPWGNATNC